jgi:hypothetical protein
VSGNFKSSKKGRNYQVVPGVYTPVGGTGHYHDRLQITFVLQPSPVPLKAKKRSTSGSFGDTDEVTYTITNSDSTNNESDKMSVELDS